MKRKVFLCLCLLAFVTIVLVGWNESLTRPLKGISFIQGIASAQAHPFIEAAKGEHLGREIPDDWFISKATE